jgi:transcriptional regulator
VYLPAVFAMSPAEAIALSAAHPLAQLVVATPEGLVATPVPLVWRDGSLVGHLARPNSLWRHAGPAVALFTGPQAYVSPSWYPSKHEHGKVVPTWNYTVVHVHGTLVAHDDDEWKREVLALLTDTFEVQSASPWQMTDAPPSYLDAMVRGVVGIELVDVRVEGKAKLSQNRDDADRGGVIDALLDGSPSAVAVAEAMGADGSASPDGSVRDSAR